LRLLYLLYVLTFLIILRSLKVGGVEATFSERSIATIKEADLHLEDLREALTLGEYARFGPEYIYSESPRGQARKLFGPTKLEAETGPIAELLISGYFHPIIVSLVCLNEVHEIGSASQDGDLASFVYAWEHLLLSTHGNGTLSDDPKLERANRDSRVALIKSYLVRLRNSGWAVARRVNIIAPACVKGDQGPVEGFSPPGEASASGRNERKPTPSTKEIADCTQQYDEPLTRVLEKKGNSALVTIDTPEIKRDAECIEANYERALAILQTTEDDKAPIISLMAIDAYVTGATADLIALISGQQKDKAIFLTRMLDQFPQICYARNNQCLLSTK
jgi:hypothetical protein